MRKAKTKSERALEPRRLKNDYFETKCYSRTSLPAFVKQKEVVPCFRYKNGQPYDDKHYVTTIVLSDGTEILSYSKILFSRVKENESFEIPVSFLTLPSGKQIIYA